MALSLSVFGLGNVGRVLARQAITCGASLVAIADSSGVLMSDKSIAMTKETLEEVLMLQASGLKLKDVQVAGLTATSVPVFLEKRVRNNSVLADCSAFDNPNQYLLPSIRNGVPVALANKTPLTGNIEYFRELVQDRSMIRFESTVGAGLPVVHTLRRLLDAGDEIKSVQGVLSGTLGYIFSELSTTDNKFSQIVKSAHKNGFTEPDPRDDLSGKDVARKVLILSRMLGYEMNLEDIEVESLYTDDMSSLSVEDFLQALPSLDDGFVSRKNEAGAKNHCLRYVAEISCSGSGKPKVSVGVKQISMEDELSSLRGTDNCIVFESSSYNTNKLIVKGPGAGLDVTAQSVLADCFDLQGKIRYC